MFATRRNAALLELRNQPRPSDAKELDGHPGYFRIWLQGDYRLVWYADDLIQLVDIYYVGLKYDELYLDNVRFLFRKLDNVRLA